MKSLVIFTFCSLFALTAAHAQSAAGAKAQLNPLDTLGYRLSAVSNVKDVALVTGMSAAKQLTLVSFFQNAEDNINNAVNSGASGKDLQALQNQLAAQFQSLLSAQELTLYRQQRPNSIYGQVLTTAAAH